MSTEQRQQAWPIDKIEPGTTTDLWKVWFSGVQAWLSFNTEELVAAGITPPQPAIHLTATWPNGTTTTVDINPNDAEAWVEVWTGYARNTTYRRAAVAVAHLLTPTTEGSDDE